MSEGKTGVFKLTESARIKLASWLDRSAVWVSENWGKVRSVTSREKKETVEALLILKRIILLKEVSAEDKKFVKSQSGDIVKILFLISIKFIPIPIPMTPMLIYLGKKIGVDFLPKKQRD